MNMDNLEFDRAVGRVNELRASLEHEVELLHNQDRGDLAWQLELLCGHLERAVENAEKSVWDKSLEEKNTPY